MSTHVLCPHCGTEFEIANESDKCNHSPLTNGLYYLVPKSTSKLSQDVLNQFINNLENAHISNGNLIIPNGNTDIDPFDEFDANHPDINLNNIDINNDDDEDDGYDEIEKSILNDGYIPNNQLWRRWIMAQMLRHYKDENGNSNFDSYFVSGKPYRYQWETILNEIKALRHLSGQELIDRERFFNMDVIKAAAKDYEKRIDFYIRKKAKRHIDKGLNKKNINKDIIRKHTYVKMPYSQHAKIYLANDANITDIKHTTYSTFTQLVHEQVHRILTCDNYNELYYVVKNFMKKCPLNVPLMKSSAWKNAFKGAGAYYTMDNMIKFHDCNFIVSGKKVTTQQSLHMLENKTIEYRNEYYKLYALMKQFVKDNNFDYEQIISN